MNNSVCNNWQKHESCCGCCGGCASGEMDKGSCSMTCQGCPGKRHCLHCQFNSNDQLPCCLNLNSGEDCAPCWCPQTKTCSEHIINQTKYCELNKNKETGIPFILDPTNRTCSEACKLATGNCFSQKLDICKQTVPDPENQCLIDPISGQRSKTCTYFFSKDTPLSIPCRDFYNSLSEEKQKDVIDAVCPGEPTIEGLPECRCVNRELDEDYWAVEANAPPICDGCWWKPCNDPDHYFQPPNLREGKNCKCPSTICGQFNSFFNDRDIDLRNIQNKISCNLDAGGGGTGTKTQTGTGTGGKPSGGGGGGGTNNKGPVPVWVYGIVGFFGIIILVLILFLILEIIKKNKGEKNNNNNNNNNTISSISSSSPV